MQAQCESRRVIKESKDCPTLNLLKKPLTEVPIDQKRHQ